MCMWNCYLLRWGHKVDGSVVIVIFLDETEGELVVDQEIVYLENQTGKCMRPVFPIIWQHTAHNKEWQPSEGYTQSKLPSVAYTTTDGYDSVNIHGDVCPVMRSKETYRLMETSEIKMPVIKSNGCNQGVQFSHQVENKCDYLTLTASSKNAPAAINKLSNY